MWWSWALSLIGILSLYLIENMDRRGFLVGLAVEVLWLWYAIATEQWGFAPAVVVYSWLYWRGWKKWAKVGPKRKAWKRERTQDPSGSSSGGGLEPGRRDESSEQAP